LRDHPEAFVPRERKELGWFSSDDGRVDNFDLYCRLFVPGRDKPRRVDISPAYLYTENTPLAIRDACGMDVRIVILVRNPVEAARSLWSFQVSRGYETLDFFSAVEAEAARKASPAELVGWAPNYFYIDRYRYAPQVKRFIDVFGAERVRLFVFERFFDDLQRGWRELCEFFEINPLVTPVALGAHYNRSGRQRNPYLGRIVAKPPTALRWGARALLPAALRWKVASAIETWNVIPTADRNLTSEQRASLQPLFASDITEMCRLTGIDLHAAWQ
jgi:hypothetical protein